MLTGFVTSVRAPAPRARCDRVGAILPGSRRRPASASSSPATPRGRARCRSSTSCSYYHARDHETARRRPGQPFQYAITAEQSDFVRRHRTPRGPDAHRAVISPSERGGHAANPVTTRPTLLARAAKTLLSARRRASHADYRRPRPTGRVGTVRLNQPAKARLLCRVDLPPVSPPTPSAGFPARPRRPTFRVTCAANAGRRAVRLTRRASARGAVDARRRPTARLVQLQLHDRRPAPPGTATAMLPLGLVQHSTGLNSGGQAGGVTSG